MMISIWRYVFLFLIALTPLLTKISAAQQVVGVSAFLNSTNANEIDGWSETDMDYQTAWYYDAAAIGYLFQGQTQVDARVSQIGNPSAGVETTGSTRQGSVYTVYSEHYLVAYYTFSDGSYYNPYQYPGGSSFYSPGGGDPSGTGYGSGGGYVYVTEEDIYLGYTYIQISTAPPSIISISPNSDVQGSSGTIHVQGQNLRDDLGNLNAAFRDGDVSVSVAANPSSSQADLNYTISATAVVGAHQLTVSNTWGESEPTIFTVGLPPKTVYNWPTNPCAVGSDPKTQYSSLVSTGAAGGSGTVTVSFSGTAYSAVSQAVSYGPYSTPSSIAANIAALITANYTQNGLTARAFGPNVVYSGGSAIGVVSHAITGSSFTTSVSSAAASAAGTACMMAPPAPPPLCPGEPSKDYVLAVTRDYVTWQPFGQQIGREVIYSLHGSPTAADPNGPLLTNSAPFFHATITEHLSSNMAYGPSSRGAADGQFDDLLGKLIGSPFTKDYVGQRCFTITPGFTPTGPLGPGPVWVRSLDYAGGRRTLHNTDDIRIYITPQKSFLNEPISHATPQSVELPQH